MMLRRHVRVAAAFSLCALCSHLAAFVFCYIAFGEEVLAIGDCMIGGTMDCRLSEFVALCVGSGLFPFAGASALCVALRHRRAWLAYGGGVCAIASAWLYTVVTVASDTAVNHGNTWRTVEVFASFVAPHWALGCVAVAMAAMLGLAPLKRTATH